METTARLSVMARSIGGGPKPLHTPRNTPLTAPAIRLPPRQTPNRLTHSHDCALFNRLLAAVEPVSLFSGPLAAIGIECIDDVGY
jgi:hypothetical protein